MNAEEMLPHVLSTLAAVRGAKRIRDDILVAGHMSLSNLLLGDRGYSLAAILRGDAHKDEWRFLRSLEQSSPWDEYPHSTRPDAFQEVHFNGVPAVGMLWARQNDSMILSFAFHPNWGESHVSAQFREMNDAREIIPSEVQIPNLSTREHATVHRELITSYGRTVASSSLIYEGNGFVIRIWFNEHPLPHFHVLLRRDTSDSLASLAIDTLDILAGDLPPAMRNKVKEWAESQKEILILSWERCKLGQHPYLLQEEP